MRNCISIKREFVAVDPRFGEEWPIPYKEVRAVWKAYDESTADAADELDRCNENGCCSLAKLVAYGCSDYARVPYDIALRISRSK